MLVLLASEKTVAGLVARRSVQMVLTQRMLTTCIGSASSLEVVLQEQLRHPLQLNGYRSSVLQRAKIVCLLDAAGILGTRASRKTPRSQNVCTCVRKVYIWMILTTGRIGHASSSEGARQALFSRQSHKSLRLGSRTTARICMRTVPSANAARTQTCNASSSNLGMPGVCTSALQTILNSHITISAPSRRRATPARIAGTAARHGRVVS
mmetsp:Transcript_82823/g.160058  ORF Transcript_82823/g.160058 Transcript_82823/m.160058 type:complete len:209 (-) Transcript_82823:1047-1673(-)